MHVIEGHDAKMVIEQELEELIDSWQPLVHRGENKLKIHKVYFLPFEHPAGAAQHFEFKPLRIGLENVNVAYACPSTVVVDRIERAGEPLLHRTETLLPRLKE